MWQWVVRNFLRRAAHEKLAEAVSQSAQCAKSEGQAYEASGDARAAHCHVGVVMALGAEAGGLLDRMSGVVKNHGDRFKAYEGALAGRRLVVALSGPGGPAADRVTAALLAGHNPDWILSAGFAGGLDPRLAQGDLVVPHRLVGPTSGPTRGAESDAESLSLDFQLQPSDHLHVGALLTVDHIVRTPEEKRKLFEAYQAEAVDMESLAVARRCRDAKKRFLAVRVITDTATDRLPDDVENLMKQSTLAGRAGALTGSLFRRPSRAKDLWRLKATALHCSDRLAKFLETIVGKLD